MKRILKISILPCILMIIVATAFFLKAGINKARAASSQTCSTWSTTFSPNPSTQFNQFNGVAALADNNVWAVGFYQSNSTPFADQTLIEQWNGSHWNIIASPNTGQDSVLEGVAASSATNAWAVGYSLDSTGASHALIEQWNGSSWNIIPNPAPSASELFGVTISSLNNVWAVGDYTPRSGTKTLIEHWNGTSWSVVASPNPVAAGNTLRAVAHVKGTSQVWAVGFYPNSHGVNQTLIERWNGSSWRVIASPNPGSGGNELLGVTAISASDIWAAGFYYNNNASPQTLTEHWNVSSWSVVSSPNVPASFEDILFAVDALSASNIWAVGYYTSGSTGLQQTLTEHWNGTSWSIVASANKGAHNNNLFAVSGISRTGEVWAVGTYNLGKSFSPPYRTLAEFYC